MADDLAADALLEVWRHWDRVAAAESPIAYARGVLANLARNRIRKLSRERRGLLGLGLLRPERTFAQDVDVPVVIDVREALRRPAVPAPGMCPAPEPGAPYRSTIW